MLNIRRWGYVPLVRLFRGVTRPNGEEGGRAGLRIFPIFPIILGSAILGHFGLTN